jgi:hypothetical protein
MGRHKTLSQYDADDDASPFARQERARVTRDNREPSTRRMAPGSGCCWCFAPYGHSWPGKDSGAPHPRPAVLGAPFEGTERW